MDPETVGSPRYARLRLLLWIGLIVVVLGAFPALWTFGGYRMAKDFADGGLPVEGSFQRGFMNMGLHSISRTEAKRHGIDVPWHHFLSDRFIGLGVQIYNGTHEGP